MGHKKSISFGVTEVGDSISISWSGATPSNQIETKSIKKETQNTSLSKPTTPKKEGEIESIQAIADNESSVLILGTMPGVESLKQQAYYSHPRNLFWRLIDEVVGSESPKTYEDRVAYLKENKIALWDMCQSCIREGSLDSNISEETPNDITSFVADHPSIKAIAFNGASAAKIFKKHVGQINGVQLVHLPSTSPANAGIKWETKVEEWSELKEYL